VILAGDIGGTHARLALFRDNEQRSPARLEVFPSDEFSDFESILERFLDAESDAPHAASFGVAGPVRDGRSLPVNLEWAIDSAAVASLLGLSVVGLINDLEAAALGLDALDSGDLRTVNVGVADPEGTRAIIAAGTGLGQAGLAKDGDTLVPIATEGGNAGFAPATHEQVRLLEFLRGEAGAHVSTEEVCSGYGLVNVYRWCLHEAGRSEPSWLRDPSCEIDVPAVVSGKAEDGSDVEAARALAAFAQIYGSEAGNLALRFMATGGVYVAGGMAMKLADSLVAGGFLDAFFDKGRLSDLLRSMPVHIVLNDSVALIGAARHAARAGIGEAS